jgi:hypothetical protein
MFMLMVLNLIGRPTCFGDASLVASLSYSFCSLCNYRRVVTSMREGKGWTPCTFTFDRLDRVVLARWLHLQVILDPLDKHSTFLRSPFHLSLHCLL